MAFMQIEMVRDQSSGFSHGEAATLNDTMPL
jgi:hypothetical protein